MESTWLIDITFPDTPCVEELPQYQQAKANQSAVFGLQLAGSAKDQNELDDTCSKLNNGGYNDWAQEGLVIDSIKSTYLPPHSPQVYIGNKLTTPTHRTNLHRSLLKPQRNLDPPAASPRQHPTLHNPPPARLLPRQRHQVPSIRRRPLLPLHQPPLRPTRRLPPKLRQHHLHPLRNQHNAPSTPAILLHRQHQRLRDPGIPHREREIVCVYGGVRVHDVV